MHKNCYRIRNRQVNSQLRITARRYVLVGVTRRQHRHESVSVGRKTVPVQGGFGACFCRHGTNLIEHYACRGTILIGGTNLSPVTNLVTGTGAVSRQKLSRSQKVVKVYWILIACRCACPDARAITNVSWVQELSKNRDKPIKHTVRVMLRRGL